jgi:heat-inducible transcriptional repressor
MGQARSPLTGGAAPPPLSERARAVLYAVVTEFIQTGEPVGSRTLSTHYGLDLSAASIRNVLKDLEEEGYLSMPHTSAGRVPTRPAFQLFIDALMQVRKLPTLQVARIQELFARDLGPSQLLQESGRLLSDLSGLPAVVLRARSETRSVEKLRFISTRPGELLSVVVLDDGSVENRFIHPEAPIDAVQLERVHNLLDEVTTGRTLAEVRRYLEQLRAREQAELGGLIELGDFLVGSAMQTVAGQREVIVEGRSTLLSHGGDPERVKNLMVALEDRKQLGDLLDRTLSTTRVQVFLGQEAGADPGGDSPLTLVAAPYGLVSGEAIGAVGTVGPTRMDYPGLVPLVETMARALGRSLGQAAEEAGAAPSSRVLEGTGPDGRDTIDRRGSGD